MRKREDDTSRENVRGNMHENVRLGGRPQGTLLQADGLVAALRLLDMLAQAEV